MLVEGAAPEQETSLTIRFSSADFAVAVTCRKHHTISDTTLSERTGEPRSSDRGHGAAIDYVFTPMNRGCPVGDEEGY